MINQLSISRWPRTIECWFNLTHLDGTWNNELITHHKEQHIIMRRIVGGCIQRMYSNMRISSHQVPECYRTALTRKYYWISFFTWLDNYRSNTMWKTHKLCSTHSEIVYSPSKSHLSWTRRWNSFFCFHSLKNLPIHILFSYFLLFHLIFFFEAEKYHVNFVSAKSSNCVRSFVYALSLNMRENCYTEFCRTVCQTPFTVHTASSKSSISR